MIFIPAVLAKQPLNVHWTVSIKRLISGVEHANVAVIDYSSDSQVHTYFYEDPDEMTDETSKQKTFDESTEVFKNTSAVFSAEGFNGNVEVIELPKNAPSADSASVSNGTVSETSDSGIGEDILNSLDYEVGYVVPTKNVSEKDIESITDALFSDRAGIVVYQTSSKDDMHNFYNHIQSVQSGKYGNAYGIYENRNDYEGAQVAGVVSANAPCDFMKVGNLSEFEATDLTSDQVKDVESCNFNVILNKADDLMLDTDLAVNGSYIDQFANIQRVITVLTYYTQRFLNNNETPFNNQTIHNLKGMLKGILETKLSKLFLGRPEVHVTYVDHINPQDIETRTFRNVSVTGQIFGDIQNVIGKLDVTA